MGKDYNFELGDMGFYSYSDSLGGHSGKRLQQLSPLTMGEQKID